MTTEADTTGREAWQQALDRFEALRILFEADDRWGPLFRATSHAEYLAAARFPPIGETQEQMAAQLPEANARQEAELARHMSAIYEPFIAAGMALVRTPAPDLAAVRVKHGLCGSNDFDLPNYEDEEGELFGIIRADIARLTGIEV